MVNFNFEFMEKMQFTTTETMLSFWGSHVWHNKLHFDREIKDIHLLSNKKQKKSKKEVFKIDFSF